MAETATMEHEHETSSRSRKARGREVVTRRDDVMLFCFVVGIHKVKEDTISNSLEGQMLHEGNSPRAKRSVPKKLLFDEEEGKGGLFFTPSPFSPLFYHFFFKNFILCPSIFLSPIYYEISPFYKGQKGKERDSL